MKARPTHWMAALAALATAFVTACATGPSDPSRKPGEKPAKEAPQLVGRIASVPADKRFVLIQSYGPWKMQAGAVMTSRGTEERTANLLATGEVLGQFAAADVQSGLVEVGDAVYSRHVPEPKTPDPTPEPTGNEPLNDLARDLKNN